MLTPEHHEEVKRHLARIEAKVERLAEQLERAGGPAEYCSVEEAARILGLTQVTVQRWCRNGTLKATKLGRSHKHPWRVPRAELDRFLAGPGPEGGPK